MKFVYFMVIKTKKHLELNMLYLFFFTLIFSSSFSLQAQVKSGIKALNKGDYSAAISAFEADMDDELMGIVARFNMAKIYKDEAYDGHNLDTAYDYLNQAQEAYGEVPYSDRDKLTKADETIRGMKKMKRDLAKAAAVIAEEAATLEAYDHFINIYSGADRSLDSRLQKKRNSLVFKNAKEANNLAAYEAMMDNYKPSLKAKSGALYKKAMLGHFEHYINEKGWSAYDAFEEKYPYNVYVKDSFKTDFDKARVKNTAFAYKDFINTFPTSSYVNMAATGMADQIIKTGGVDDYRYFVTTFPENSKVNEVWLGYYKAYKMEYGDESINTFKYEYENFPHQELLEKDLNKHNSVEEDKAYNRAMSTRTFVDYQDFIQAYPMSSKMESVVDGVYKAILEDNLMSEYEYFITSFPRHEKTEDMWMKLYELYKEQQGMDKLNKFKIMYPEFPYQHKLNADLREYEANKKE